MALDFHLAKNKKEAPYKVPSYSIEWRMHKAIFIHHELNIESYPLLGRLKNYYNDAKYGTEESQNLVKEIEKIKPHFDNPQIIEQLNSISLVCLEAQERNLGIWVYCD